MPVHKDEDGTIWAPMRAEGPDGMIGDGMVPLRPGDPGYDEYDAWLARQARRLSREPEEAEDASAQAPAGAATMMTGTLRDDEARSFVWLSVEPHMMGDPELVARIRTHLFVLGVRGERIPVTPTGPWVEPVESSQEAVFAAGNAVTRYGLAWAGAPDVTYGAAPDTIF